MPTLLTTLVAKSHDPSSRGLNNWYKEEPRNNMSAQRVHCRGHDL